MNETSATRVAFSFRNGFKSATIIDHVITDLYRCEFSISLKDTTISDHRAMLTSVDLIQSDKTPDSNIRKKKTTKCLDTKRLKTLLQNGLHDDKCEDDCVKDSTRIIKHPKRDNQSKPWVTTDLIHMISQRDRYYSLSKRTNSEYFKTEYKHYKHQTERTRIALRKTYYSGLML